MSVESFQAGTVRAIDAMKAIGLDVGSYRLSLYGLFSTIIVVVLLWVYYSAQIFLFGAEFTWVYSHRFGSRKGQPLPVTAAVFPAPQ